MTLYRLSLVLLLLLSSSCSSIHTAAQSNDERSWIAGDHHIHSRWSVGWDRSVAPPTPIKGGDAIYPIHMNALMAQYHGLSWMVATDHGGPNHSKVNTDLAYPEMLESRKVVPGVIQFWGMELDTPAAEHSSLIIPHTHDEASVLEEIERRWARNESWPPDSTRNTLIKMIEALDHMKDLDEPPVVIANHPGRTARGLAQYSIVTPEELREWNNTAPNVAIGMAGAPGHQAAAINPDGSLDSLGTRGGYRGYATMGGFDQLTARVGGFWDSMLGEGRKWWITANSDSHVHWTEGGSDFWPGEFSKTYVWAEKSYDGILEGLRHGHIFVTTGDLISELYVTAGTAGVEANIGSTLAIQAGADVVVTIRFRDPQTTNSHGDDPAVTRVDLITGLVTGGDAGPVVGGDPNTNPSAKVIARFGPGVWKTEGEYRTVTHHLRDLHANMYLRVRGTNGTELEPEQDPVGENPWTDLWFYSNPVFLEAR